jgi:indolepyruvate ferredoxin oxidoreductase
MFEGDYRVVYHLAPPLLTRKEEKMRFGGWMLPVFRVLKGFKFLRGTALDPFGYTAERRTERALAREYEETVERLLARLEPQNHALAVQIAAIPDEIRGFGHIKARTLDPARKKRDELLARYEAGRAAEKVAA